MIPPTVLDTACIEYQGYRNERGYGRRMRKTDKRYVHRAVWEEAHGPIPPGMCVLHRCDNPPCYRLDHLFLGTRRDNSNDMVAKGRKKGIGGRHGQRELCKHGHRITERNGRRRCYICKAAYDADRARRRADDVYS